MSAIYVEITATRGSTPRDAGTVMRVTADDLEGTIGGGALEHRAITRARAMLLSGQSAFEEALPLGPNLGQCCGGSVSLRYSNVVPAGHLRPLRQMHVHTLHAGSSHPHHVWLWGAGHVGRAFVDAAHPQGFKITWVDTSADRFPPRVGKHVKTIPAADMPLLARRAAQYADHLIFTYSHDIDLALCAALLKREVRSVGLIGSETKRTRFFKRLRAMGLDPSPIICPIGDKTRGKRPDQIASGVVEALLTPTAKACT